MNRIEHLEQAVRQLPPSDLAEFRNWFLEFDADAWDQQIERDARAGRHDDLAARALDAHQSGKTTPL